MPTKNEKVHACVENYICSRITVCPKTGCWLWGKVTRGNYGWFKFEDMLGKCAHVQIFELNCGPVPKGLIVRHTCDDTRCVNPAHLVLGTKKDNRQDFMRRHPRAKEILREGAKRAQRGCKKFWANMTKQEREAFCAQRLKIQREKHPPGSEMYKKAITTRNKNFPKGHPVWHKKALKAWETRRARYGN